jgi:predicted Zn-dependent protease
LGDLAVQIRQVGHVGDVLAAYSYYLEGRAELALHRTPLALNAFRKILLHSFGNPNLALFVAKNLRSLGYGEIAKDLLAKLDREFGTNIDYWKQVFEVAIELKDQDLFYTAARTLYRLSPDDWIVRNNYASALITLRRDPTEEIKLTMQLMAQRPHAAATKINHGLALLQMQRAAEAQAVLDSLDLKQLSPVESSALHQARFELYFSRRDFKQALESNAQIDRQLLFPCERQWLDDALAQIAGPSNP